MSAHERLGDLVRASSRRNKQTACADVYSVTNSGGFVPSGEYFSKEVYSKELSGYKVVDRGMIAYNPSRINVGSVAVQDKCERAIVSPLYVVFSVDQQRILPEFVCRFLKSGPGQSQISFLSTGTVRNNLKFDALSRMAIPVPDLETQRRQVRVLRAVESQVSLLGRYSEKLDELVKSRFIEMFGDLEKNPNNWPVRHFSDFAVIDTHMTNDFENYANSPHIGIDSIEANTGRLIGYRTVAEDGVKSGKYPFDQRHIIYSKIRPNLNKVALPTFSGVCSADAYPILPISDACNREYLAYVMRSQYFLKYILPLSGRAQMPKVNKEALQGFSMPVPPIDLQREFAEFVAKVDKSAFISRKGFLPCGSK